MRHINEQGLAIIKDSENCELTVYTCPGGKRTIGWGHVLADDTPDGFTITQEQADNLLKEDLADAEEQVSIVTQHVPLTDNQFSALVCWNYNVGFQNMINSTLLKKLKAGDYPGAADEFERWIYSKGKKLPGLVIRRAKERALFLEA